MRIHNSKKLLNRRRELRENSTETEKLLWERLRDSKLDFKFKRQHSVGGYILDFFCPSKRLVVEVDGKIHELSKLYDKNRDKFLEEFGYTVLRFKVSEVESNLDNVTEKIKNELDRIPFSLPRRRGRG
ncbi:MAG: DUF559 domain-containing protein [bacterium]|nr:DUF559 domain-containing protein [bacterium]